MSISEQRVVVVGAGIQGSCTALYLAKQGRKVLLIEQFPLPHTRGSSHGQSRIIRSAYSEDFFTRMMADAFELWREIEKESKSEIIWKTGLLMMAKPPYDNIEESLKNMSTICPENLGNQELSAAKLEFPMINFTDDMKTYVDKSGGIIKASIALQTIQNLFRQHGGVILDGSPVTNIKANSDNVVVYTDDKAISCSSLVLCCGPWTNKALKFLDLELPLQPQRIQVFYYKEKTPGEFSMKAGFPAFINANAHGAHIFGGPSIEYAGMVKVCVHFGANCDPDNRDKAPGTTEVEARKLLKEFIELHFPGVESEPAIVETCMYTVTPDDSYFLDYHPKHPNIVIGAGFSGSGFKIAPLVGQILGQLAIGIKPKHDLTPFRVDRY